ncbi:unnamed protein product [marine sediment metagenome]|uniref:Uncharacterized protein n=1 Tax=marine sediment metagenome TaxID=412755 RepID=X0SVP3_9ZZZZ
MKTKATKTYCTIDPATGKDHTCVCKIIVDIKTGKVVKTIFKKLHNIP